MRPTPILEVPPVELALIARAGFASSPGGIAELRKAPDPSGTIAVHPSLLRHADEQTVVGLAAVFLAIRGAGLDLALFADWSVLAAPRYLGRAAFERAFPTFVEEGAWGVSPHLIPAHSLHSPSGTISQALKAQGPNLGVGGTPGGEREAFLYATTLLLAGPIPGVWVVLTGRVGESDGTRVAGDYEALALALTLPVEGSNAPTMQISPSTARLVGPIDDASRQLARWLEPGMLRADRPHSPGTIPSPHFRLHRPGRPTGSGDLS